MSWNWGVSSKNQGPYENSLRARKDLGRYGGSALYNDRPVQPYDFDSIVDDDLKKDKDNKNRYLDERGFQDGWGLGGTLLSDRVKNRADMTWGTRDHQPSLTVFVNFPFNTITSVTPADGVQFAANLSQPLRGYRRCSLTSFFWTGVSSMSGPLNATNTSELGIWIQEFSAPNSISVQSPNIDAANNFIPTFFFPINAGYEMDATGGNLVFYEHYPQQVVCDIEGIEINTLTFKLLNARGRVITGSSSIYAVAMALKFE